MGNLTKTERLRRVALLCCHFERNLAYYRAWHGGLTPGDYGEILATIDGNFIDMAVIEWCKIFGDIKGKHHWRKVVDHQDFETEMLKYLNQSSEEFKNYVNENREYRDKFIAHLDDEVSINIPKMDKAKDAVEFLYGYLTGVEASTGIFIGLPTGMAVYYEGCFNKASAFFARSDLDRRRKTNLIDNATTI